MNEEYDPGSRVQASTLQSLRGLESLVVAVTNTYQPLHKSWLRNAILECHKDNAQQRARNSTGVLVDPGPLACETAASGGGSAKGRVVKVIFDRLENGWCDVEEAQGLLRSCIEGMLGAVGCS